MTNGSLMKVESIAECSKGSILQFFWPAFLKMIIGIENQFSVFLRVAVLHRFYCTHYDICSSHMLSAMWSQDSR